jgi:hypothetical protein
VLSVLLSSKAGASILIHIPMVLECFHTHQPRQKIKSMLGLRLAGKFAGGSIFTRNTNPSAIPCHSMGRLLPDAEKGNTFLGIAATQTPETLFWLHKIKSAEFFSTPEIAFERRTMRQEIDSISFIGIEGALLSQYHPGYLPAKNQFLPRGIGRLQRFEHCRSGIQHLNFQYGVPEVRSIF